MSKYLPLFWDKRQIPALIYRIYINIFGIFLRIPMIPLAIDWKYKQLEVWYKGDTLLIFYKKGIRRYVSLGCEGEFLSLKEVDDFWNQYWEAEREICEREDKEYQYRIKNGLCTEPFCNIEGEHKKHEN